MNDLTIVTAFFDIGRGDWSPEKGLPAYLQRTTDTYFERFGHMAKLDNHIIVFTSEDFVDRIKEIRGGKPITILTIDFLNSFVKLREEVSRVQKSAEYQAKINPTQVRNPEYWNADYVIVNALKSSFVSQAIQRGIVETDMIAWLDFGYCREGNTLNGVTKWQYPFDKDKIHFFNIKEWVKDTFIQDVIANNDVHITGPMIVASKKNWPVLQALVHHSISELLKNDLIDDDQTLLLMSYLQKPELFELHPLTDGEWFVAFKDYNENTN